ncbi:MAG: chemotaxis protein [Sulfurimonas sp.]|jgi:methyl-accepting chemotaxis protein|nr:chemotaxis protein [Sulfurimonas sp.]
MHQNNQNLEKDFSKEKCNTKNLSSESFKNELPNNIKKEEHYLPYPATDENKMVHQLDDLTKESEKKATEIFDILENISNNLQETEQKIDKITEVLNKNIKLFTTLSTKFSNIAIFKSALKNNNSILNDANKTLAMLQTSGDSIVSTMDIMQYQDIHRQKIERVINVMRSLSNYTNNLLESKIDDKKRVSSAQHIQGDIHNELASEKEIETLLTEFGKKPFNAL